MSTVQRERVELPAEPPVRRFDREHPANVITLARAVLVGVVSVLAALSYVGPDPRTAIVVLATVALVLDWVDGRVARRTRSETVFGARFDMEVDAALILVLSAYVDPVVGAWVLSIGLFRYALLGAERVVPWLRRPIPPRYWGKVVAAVQGIALTVVAAGVLPRFADELVLAVALALLVESFARQVWWLWRTRRGPVPETPFTWPVTVLALALVWVGLTLPDRVTDVSPAAFVRLPIEALVLLLLATVLPARVRTGVAAVAGVALALVTIAHALDMGFYFALNRSFDPVTDWSYVGSLAGLLRDGLGLPAAIVLLTVAALLFLGFLVLLPLALRRLGTIVARHRSASLRAVAALAVAWVLALALGIHVQALTPAVSTAPVPHALLASTSTSSYAAAEVARIPAELADQREFARDAAHDPLGKVPPSQLLRGLRGKDVIFAFVESYGRSAVQGSSFAPGVDRVLDRGTQQLAAKGFSARSAFMTSPTFGAISWLAHSTFQSGLWVDSQPRYNVLVKSPRLTLARLFGRAGWRTVSDIPADTQDWPQGRFYGYEKFYDSRNVGYRGPRFGYPTMPDQFSLDALHRLELAKAHRSPVMAEIDLVTSHAPWSRTPRMVPQAEVGNGSIYQGMPETLPSMSTIWRSADRVRAAYGQSVEYSLRSLVSFVQHYGTSKTVLVFLGDHQPATIVSGQAADHDVPVTIVAKDPAVLRRIDTWGWQPGLRPSPDTPVWRMDSFRDRFVHTFAR